MSAAAPPGGMSRPSLIDVFFDIVESKSFRAVVSLAGFLFLWWLVTAGLKLLTPLLLPDPIAVVRAIVDLIQGQELFSGGVYGGNLIGQMIISTSRVVTGFVLACLVAIPLGVAAATNSLVNDLLDPIVQMLLPIPPIAWTPLAILWFGLGLESIIFLIFISAFFPIFINTVPGVARVNPTLKRAAQSLGASRSQVLRQVVLPAASPFLFAGIRLGFSAAWKTIVAAELIAATSGLGYLIMNARSILATPDVISGMVAIGVLGLVFDRIFLIAERRVYRHRLAA